LTSYSVTCVPACFIPLLAALLSVQTVSGQTSRLKPGFDKAEYQELIYAHALLYDTAMTNRQKFKIPRPDPL
jgi:hypothetical protein